jgi:hypothetical protein
MRKLAAAIVCGGIVAMAGAAPNATAQTAGFTYAYANGVATATERDDRGRVTATIACRPPTGDIVLSDYTLVRQARRARTASVRVGNLSVEVPMRLEGRGRDRAVVINLPQRPPILAAVQPTDRLTVTVNGESRTLAAGSAAQMKDVAFACWGS